MISKAGFMVCAMALACSQLFGQTNTGIIAGTLVDPSGLGVPNMTVLLIEAETGMQTRSKTDSRGEFVIGAVLPGRYTLRVDAPGFKQIEERNLNVTSGERLVAGRLQLEVGSVAESVTVSARGTSVDIESNERSSVLTSDELHDLLTRGRDYMSLLRILPGAVGNASAFEPDGESGLSPSFSGMAAGFNAVYFDGASNNDVNNPGYRRVQTSLDAVEEVTVVQTNFKAEDGRGGGAVIKVVSKSGTRDFHGSAFSFLRNEDLNANFYFNNLNGLPRPRYRYNTSGGTVNSTRQASRSTPDSAR